MNEIFVQNFVVEDYFLIYLTNLTSSQQLQNDKDMQTVVLHNNNFQSVISSNTSKKLE